MPGVRILKEMHLLSFTRYILCFILHGHFVNCFRVHFFCTVLFTFSWIVFAYFFSGWDLFLSFTAEFFRLLLSWYIVNTIYGWISAVFRPSGHTTVIVVFAFSFLFLLLCYNEFLSFKPCEIWTRTSRELEKC